MKNVAVIGATGDVGRGIVDVMLRHGHRVAAIARDAVRLASLAAEHGQPDRLLTVAGSVANEAVAADLQTRLLAGMPRIDAVVVSVNARRDPASLLTRSSGELTRYLESDLITYFVAAKTFIPSLVPGGVYLGIGGGACDFVLHDGIPQSIAQAGLRMLHRGLAHEFRDRDVHVKELIVASVVNGVSTRAFADPLWVTEAEIGERVAQIVGAPREFPDPIHRIARRDESGKPVCTSEGRSRVQGFRQSAEAT